MSCSDKSQHPQLEQQQPLERARVMTAQHFASTKRADKATCDAGVHVLTR
eukprot:COSAG06_NODE_1250_length_10106_cov_413.553113_11_plen_50_part_00